MPDHKPLTPADVEEMEHIVSEQTFRMGDLHHGCAIFVNRLAAEVRDSWERERRLREALEQKAGSRPGYGICPDCYGRIKIDLNGNLGFHWMKFNGVVATTICPGARKRHDPSLSTMSRRERTLKRKALRGDTGDGGEDG